MAKDGELVDALYYSTSCGLQLDQDLSLEPVFAAFLSVKHEGDYEKDGLGTAGMSIFLWNGWRSWRRKTDTGRSGP